MSVTNLVLNGNVYALMESTLKRPKAAERWFAICPLKGDGKWFAKTKEDLIARIEEEEGVKASTFKPKKVKLWFSEAEYNGKPIVQWFTDGTMDVDTPTARFRIEMNPVRNGRVAEITPVNSEDLNLTFYEFCDELSEANSGNYLRGVLTKIRLKNPDGTTLRDIEGLSVTCEQSCVTPMELLDQYVDGFIESGCNDLVSFVYALGEDGDADGIHGYNLFTRGIILDAQSVFLTVDAMNFISQVCTDGVEYSEGNSHHCNSNLSSADARAVLVRIQNAATALSSIL